MKKLILFFALALGGVALAATTVSKAYVDKNDTETLEAARTYTCLLYTSPSPRDS